MKIAISFLLSFISIAMFGQDVTIEVCEFKTSHLIFPDRIIYADLGDDERGLFNFSEYMLKIKGDSTMRQTNLTVITENQDYYSFGVYYRKNPKLNYFIQQDQRIKNLASKTNIGKTKESMNASTFNQAMSKAVKADVNNKRRKLLLADIQKDILHQKAEGLLRRAKHFDHVGKRRGDIKLKVTSIYHDLNNCFIVYEVENLGAIPYDISYLEFGKKDKHRPKKSALNQEILNPILIINANQSRILPYKKNHYVAVFDKMEVPQGKMLYMELVENGRNIQLDIPFNQLQIKKL